MRQILFITGAGSSAESGIKTFRDSGGLWEEYSVDDVCNINTFERNYDMVHEFYNKRRAELASVEPNAFHQFVANLQTEMMDSYSVDVNVITTNVDDLLERAGVRAPLHVHGYLPQVIKNYGTPEYEIINVGYQEFDYKQPGFHKPNVVFFGEMAPAYQKMHTIMQSCGVRDLVFVVGCSNQVIPFQYYVGDVGEKYGCPKSYWINPDQTDARHFTEGYDGTACNAIPFIRSIIDRWLDS